MGPPSGGVLREGESSCLADHRGEFLFARHVTNPWRSMRMSVTVREGGMYRSSARISTGGCG